VNVSPSYILTKTLIQNINLNSNLVLDYFKQTSKLKTADRLQVLHELLDFF